MKTGVEYFNAYKELKPYNIFIQRKPEDVARSLATKRRDVEYDEALTTVQWRFTYMRNIFDGFGGVFIDTDDIKAGDFSSIEEAMNYCGLEYSEEATRKGITR